MLIVTVTSDSEAELAGIVRGLVEDGRIACAQIDGPIRSIYRWDGDVVETAEWRATIKVAAPSASDVVARIRSAHSYDTPEIVVVDVAGGDADYLEWVIAESS